MQVWKRKKRLYDENIIIIIIDIFYWISGNLIKKELSFIIIENRGHFTRSSHYDRNKIWMQCAWS